MDCRTTIRGKEVQYTAASEEFPFFDELGEMEYTIHTISYVRTDGVVSGRPVIFAYNGGPGAASTLVNLGALAPERVKMGDAVSMHFTPPFEMETNPDTVLDICDIVTIDPIGCGFSRIFKPEVKRYFNSESDASVIVQVIYKWLSAHRKWNCPVFIMGESYGTIRNALIAEQIYLNTSGQHCNALNIHLNGIIMLGTALDHGQTPLPIETAVINFSSIAASWWYHHREVCESLDEFLEEAENFAYRRYLPALALGDSISTDEKEEIISRLHYFTGLTREQIINKRLRVETSDYPLMYMRNENRLISRYDGRFLSGKMDEGAAYDAFGDDPCSNRIMPAFTHCFNGYFREKLGINEGEVYDGLSMKAAVDWDFHTAQSPYICLKNAMRKNPGLKVMFGTGYYDMLTTAGYTRYLVRYAGLPQDRVRLRYYESGHMPYLGEKPAKKLGEDLRSFIDWGCGGEDME